MRTLILALSCLLFAGTASAQGTISVSGEALLYVVPDEIIIGLGIETFDASLARATTQNDTETRRLLDALQRLEIENRHIQTDTMQVEMHYRTGHPSEGIEGYYVRRAFTVTLRDPAIVERTVASALGSGANHIMGLEFRTTELRRLRDEARKKAMGAAREKAQLLAGEAGVRIGRATSISEGYYGSINGSRWWGWNGGGANYIQNAVQGGAAAGADGSTIPLGQIGVSATVSIQFLLESL
jgi:uncharacterized protein YggE